MYKNMDPLPKIDNDIFRAKLYPKLSQASLKAPILL